MKTVADKNGLNQHKTFRTIHIKKRNKPMEEYKKERLTTFRALKEKQALLQALDAQIGEIAQVQRELTLKATSVYEEYNQTQREINALIKQTA